MPSTMPELRIGRTEGAGYYVAPQDDHRIYNRKLSANEVLQLYHASRTGYQAELRRFWRPSALQAAAAEEYLPYDIQHSPQHQAMMAM